MMPGTLNADLPLFRTAGQRSRDVAIPALVAGVAAALAGLSPVLVVALTLAGAMAAWDVREYRIPNALTHLMAVCAVFAFITSGASVLALVLALIVGGGAYLLWDAGQMGGGDVKLLPSLALLAASLAAFPELGILRVQFTLIALLSAALLFALATRKPQLPLAVGAPLALAVAALI